MPLSTISMLTELPDTEIRIIIEAECSSCGTIACNRTVGLDIIHNAARHTAQTGHIVILNGTVDCPDLEG